MTTPSAARWHAEVPCTDVVGRPAHLRVTVRHDRQSVAIQTPAAETAQLTGLGLRRLAEALDAAAGCLALADDRPGSGRP
jgi:hypothetical protein